LCSYLDQGVALWHFPFVEEGLIPDLRHVEKNGLSSFFKTKRARNLLFDESATVESLLELVVGDEKLYEQYLFDQQFSHRGWAGMVSAIEDRPDTILYPKKIALKELIFFELLLGVMRPLPPVCGGINLEYYFSRIDNQKLGAGTKLPHNVMGLIGVSNSNDGDLRPGLPLQMIEVHDPVRLLILVEHYPEVVLKTVKAEQSLHEWFSNEWVHLVAIHPDENRYFRFSGGEFFEYKPMKGDIRLASDIHNLIESAEEMETNHILHATLENLPIHIIKK